MKSIALLGAGGKMGCRITDNLLKTNYPVRHAEIAERGRTALASRGIQAVSPEEAVAASDVVILALPDNRIGEVTRALNAQLKSGTMLMALEGYRRADCGRTPATRRSCLFRHSSMPSLGLRR